MSTNEEGTAPQFLEKSLSGKSRKSQNLSLRYAQAEERKDDVFDEAEDSDYERVNLTTEGKEALNDSRMS